MTNQFITDYLVAVNDLDEQQAKLDAANSAARRARSRVKDARECVEKLQEYADLFGVELPGSDDEDDTTVSFETEQPIHDGVPSWQEGS